MGTEPAWEDSLKDHTHTSLWWVFNASQDVFVHLQASEQWDTYYARGFTWAHGFLRP